MALTYKEFIAAHPTFAKQQFTNELDALHEEIRVIGERTEFCLAKIRTTEVAQQKAINKIKGQIIEFDYVKVQNTLEQEYLKLITGTELPATKILANIIDMHMTEIRNSINKITDTQVRTPVSNMLAEYALMYDLLKKRTTIINEEITSITEALHKEIPLSYLFKLAIEEGNQRSIDKELEKIRINLLKNVNTLQSYVLTQLVELEASMEKKHPTIAKILTDLEHPRENIEEVKKDAILMCEKTDAIADLTCVVLPIIGIGAIVAGFTIATGPLAILVGIAGVVGLMANQAKSLISVTSVIIQKLKQLKGQRDTFTQFISAVPATPLA